MKIFLWIIGGATVVFIVLAGFYVIEMSRIL